MTYELIQYSGHNNLKYIYALIIPYSNQQYLVLALDSNLYQMLTDCVKYKTTLKERSFVRRVDFCNFKIITKFNAIDDIPIWIKSHPEYFL